MLLAGHSTVTCTERAHVRPEERLVLQLSHALEIHRGVVEKDLGLCEVALLVEDDRSVAANKHSYTWLSYL